MNKQNIINVDKEKCIGCGKCKKDCVAFALDIKDAKAYQKGGCIECGHCYAVCPTNAITIEGYDMDGGELTPLDEYDSDKLLLAMKSRRTIRQFKDKKVEQEKIDMIIEAGRYSPTGANAQNISYTILGSKQDEIEKECVKLFKFGVKAGSTFKDSLKDKIIDDKFFFKGAPLVIIVSGSNSVDPALASTYMELMAESLGLGVLYSGFFIGCSRINPKITSMLKLPKGHKPVTCMVMGYPDVKYQRIVSRKKPSVKVL